jgi:hypothetical protein
MEKLEQLAGLIKERNDLEKRITEIINRPAELGHIGEYVASHVFHISLEESAAHKGSDGSFNDGALKGKLVNIKWYARREGLLDITPDSLPDYYLVMTGPRSPAISSRYLTRPWVIDNVYLFEARDLVAE